MACTRHNRALTLLMGIALIAIGGLLVYIGYTSGPLAAVAIGASAVSLALAGAVILIAELLGDDGDCHSHFCGPGHIDDDTQPPDV